MSARLSQTAFSLALLMIVPAVAQQTMHAAPGSSMPSSPISSDQAMTAGMTNMNQAMNGAQ
jgi:hypothetical protein